MFRGVQAQPVRRQGTTDNICLHNIPDNPAWLNPYSFFKVVSQAFK